MNILKKAVKEMEKTKNLAVEQALDVIRELGKVETEDELDDVFQAALAYVGYASDTIICSYTPEARFEIYTDTSRETIPLVSLSWDNKNGVTTARFYISPKMVASIIRNRKVWQRIAIDKENFHPWQEDDE